MSDYVLEEAKRCLNCKNPRCREMGCPIHTNIPHMIELLLQNRTMDAAEMLFANNPLSMVCSLVCDHAKQCEGHCVRGIKGEPVHISSIENYISDSCFERIRLDKKEPNGMKAAVIGAGPAGMTIAIRLAVLGYKVTIFEGHDKIGGVLRYGIPEFRLPKTILDRYYKKMTEELGILFRPNFSIGGSTSVRDLLNDGYSSVFIGTGAWRPRKLGIPGETFGNVAYAINYLASPEVYHLGNRVAVIGAGNAAMDAARTTIRHGAREVTVYARRDGVSASQHEVDYAKMDGVRFAYCKAPQEILDDGVVMCDVRMEEDGSRTVLKETAKKIPCDFVIIAVSQVPKDKLVNRDHELKLNERGTLIVDANGETTMDGVFACGDVVTGARTVVEAVRYAKEIAVRMDAYMQEKNSRTQNRTI